MTRKRYLAAGIAVLGLMLVPAAAQAGTLTLEDDDGAAVLVYAAGAGEANELRLNEVDDEGVGYVEVVDNGAAITVGDSAQVFCGGSPVSCIAPDFIDARLGDGNDTLEATLVTVRLRATGGAGSDTLAGGPLADAFVARDNEIDTVNCGLGQDTVTSDPGDSVATSGDQTCETNDAGGTPPSQPSGDVGLTYAVVGGVKTLSFRAAPGNVNDLTIDEFASDSPARPLWLGDRVSIALGTGAGAICSLSGANAAFCVMPDKVVVHLGDGNDFIKVRREVQARFDVFGGAGNDNLMAGPLNDLVEGGEGNDRVNGGSGGNDLLRGGAGDDEFGIDNFSGFFAEETHAGKDDISGGDGFDHLQDDRAAGVTLSLDDIANDGLTGVAEGDNAHSDIEKLQGGSGPDTLIGTDEADILQGWLGNDQIIAGGGDDLVEALFGDDRIDAGTGDDVIDASDGNDEVVPGPGRDTVSGGRGNDAVDARDGETDSVTCDLGADRVLADAATIDVVDSSCEQLERSAAPMPPPTPSPLTPTPTPSPGPAADTRLSLEMTRSARIAALRKGLTAKVTAPGAGSFVLTATITSKLANKLRLKSVTVASGRSAVKGAGRTTVALKLSKAAKKKVKRLRGATLTLKLVFTPAGGGAKTSKTAKLNVIT